MQANGVNYYKGVLLCSRPNQSPSIARQKPFCGRVNVHEQIGLVPTKQYGQHKTTKRKLPVLNNHKKWLEKFKKQLEQKKQKQNQQENKKKQYLQKIKQQAKQRIKQINQQKQKTYQKQQQQPKSQIKQQVKHQPHKKKPKPAWAQTQQQAQQHQQHQVDQLLDFFQKGNTQQVKDYLQDQDIKKILSDLKNKIQSLRQQGGEWKHNQMNKIQQRQRERNDEQKNTQNKDDILSRISKNSDSQSIASQKTVEKVEKLKEKKQTKQWDTVTKSSKTSLASVDQQIAKHIADQILRNYPNLKHHSNQSIRKLLEKQAKQELKS